MILYFKNGMGKMRKIARISDKLEVNEARAVAIKEINKFCDERNFKIYYIRIWNTKVNGQPMTQFDVGSHTEFFYTDRIVFTEETRYKNDSSSEH